LRSWEFNQNRAELELYQIVKFPELGTELRYSRNLSIKKQSIQELLQEADEKNINICLTCNRQIVLE
jgi:hypothetical protein